MATGRRRLALPFAALPESALAAYTSTSQRDTNQRLMADRRRSTYSWGLAAAAVVGALIFAWRLWLYDTRPSQEPLPAPTATTPISTDRPRILIVDFERAWELERDIPALFN